MQRSASEALIWDRAEALSAERESRAGRRSNRRVREQYRGRQGDGRELRAEGKVQRATWLGGGRRPAGTELSAPDGGQ